MVVTPLIMTLFAKGTSIQLVFLIFDEYMRRHNPNYIFFMITALFMSQKQVYKIDNNRGNFIN